MVIHDLVTEVEYSDALDGVKDLLMETYSLTDMEASSVMSGTMDHVHVFLDDYMPYIHSLQELRLDLRHTLDEQLKQAVDNEHKLQLKMSNDAAVWLAYECIRRYFKRSLL